ncbi:hypothetical protein R1sor_015429 [Riccia sorocarpa]|uniref:Uncharacterized protein n=1 Tax=Riccia sorocarpa TaxID=122646 RepID=A0ABD3HG38_9MARC
MNFAANRGFILLCIWPCCWGLITWGGFYGRRARQGDPLSPLLFNININDTVDPLLAATEVPWIPVPILALLLADDVALIETSEIRLRHELMKIFPHLASGTMALGRNLLKHWRFILGNNMILIADQLLMFKVIILYMLLCGYEIAGAHGWQSIWVLEAITGCTCTLRIIISKTLASKQVNKVLLQQEFRVPPICKTASSRLDCLKYKFMTLTSHCSDSVRRQCRLNRDKIPTPYYSRSAGGGIPAVENSTCY